MILDEFPRKLPEDDNLVRFSGSQSLSLFYWLDRVEF